MFPRHVFLQHHQSTRWPSLPGDAPAARQTRTVDYFWAESGAWHLGGGRAVISFDRDHDGNVRTCRVGSDFGSVFGEWKVESTTTSL